MSYEKAKEFKKFITVKKKYYYNQLKNKIRTLRSSNSKDYWKLLNKSTESRISCNKICLQTFMEHFKKLNSVVEADDLSNDDLSGAAEKFPAQPNNELNYEFSDQELCVLIAKLKNNKAGGIDWIRNEFLEKAPPNLITFMCHFFNLILDTGLIPDDWCRGNIMPLYKSKGSQDDPDNYRGVTLPSCLGKLFTVCLSHRISNYMCKDEKLGFEQAGFSPEFSTLDHVFTLHAIIEYYKNKKGRVYCAFVDYSKAFDRIDRASLWVKLLKNGVNGKIIQVIYNMYKNAKSCVKSCDKISDFFSCDMGVRQGVLLPNISWHCKTDPKSFKSARK